MAIVACPDCSKEVSDSAPACPNCGRPNPGGAVTTPVQGAAAPSANQVRPVGLLLGLGILIFPMLFAWFTLGKGRTTKARVLSFGYLALSIFLVYQGGNSAQNTYTARKDAYSASTPAAEPAKEQVMQVNIGKILSDYEGNEVAADNQYKGRLIQVTGLVSDIKKDITNSLYVTLGTGAAFEIPAFQAFFDDSMNSQLGALRKGQKLTVVCRVKGLMMNVLAEDCFIK